MAMGTATSVPIVPGALGDKPEPNPNARKPAGLDSATLRSSLASVPIDLPKMLKAVVSEFFRVSLLVVALYSAGSGDAANYAEWS